ncbi:hypothetical protein TEA_010330 [Camellia sinensis var. sinensis]|uniref:Uncharacterized protein n=1 Tax=Camellia sinensis var. sinensis TaxID=542762 RepID=A0A4S4DXK2_CAMSN|nr:hypothetical protein TEA_010330 [Camellia sinensis var. sinensis]
MSESSCIAAAEREEQQRPASEEAEPVLKSGCGRRNGGGGAVAVAGCKGRSVTVAMALRGVWQLQKLIVSYCDWGGSSRGIRHHTSLPTILDKLSHFNWMTVKGHGVDVLTPVLVNFFVRKQESAGGMCEESVTRRYTSTGNETKECIGKKSGEAEDETCHQAP